MPRAEAERNHRERLFAATVAIVVEKGYDATRVADLVKLAGISRSAFYRQFADKKECFLATAEQLVQPTIEVVLRRAQEAPPGEERMREAVEAFLRLVVSQPAASRMCFVEIYAAGPEAARSACSITARVGWISSSAAARKHSCLSANWR